MLELKPVRCGCGGEAEIDIVPIDRRRVRCQKCGIRTLSFATEAEAITVWNRAMCHTERTAKVRHNGDYFFCAECKEGVSLSNLGKDRYCPGCGSKLEWSEG